MVEVNPQRRGLLHDSWEYVSKRSLEEFRSEEWGIVSAQKKQYLNERQADEVLRMLTVQAADPSIGYSINMYEHSLQVATKMLRDGLSEEDVVVGLLHDVGFIVCPEEHGKFAAMLLKPYISERNYWMLEHHEVFQQVHFHELEGVDPNQREKWRDSPFFDWTAEFIAKYDQTAINYDEEILPIEIFEPMVKRLFVKPV